MDRCPQCGERLGVHEVTVKGSRLELRVRGLPMSTCPNGHPPAQAKTCLGGISEFLGNTLAASPSLTNAGKGGVLLVLNGAPGARAARSLEVTEQLGPPRRNLDELVLPTEVRAAMDRILAAFRQRDAVRHAAGRFLADRASRGRLALGGPSGVGKTEIAKGIGHRLGVPVLKVDASRVLSRFVGEANKAIRAAFAEAVEHEAILFIDEADTLVAARVDASDASAVHYNGMVNALLQELDAFDGMVICATNALDGLDPALARRFDVLRVTAPDAEARRACWREMLSSTNMAPAPTAEWIDLLDASVAKHIEAYPSAPPFTPGEMEGVLADACGSVAMRLEKDPNAGPEDRVLSQADVERALAERLSARVSAADIELAHEEQNREQARVSVPAFLRSLMEESRENAAQTRAEAASVAGSGPLGPRIAGVWRKQGELWSAHAEDLELLAHLEDVVRFGDTNDIRAALMRLRAKMEDRVARMSAGENARSSGFGSRDNGSVGPPVN